MQRLALCSRSCASSLGSRTRASSRSGSSSSPTYARRFHHDVAALEDRYRHGEIPVHLLPRYGALVERYHVPDTRPSHQTLAEPAVLFGRHGRRALPRLTSRWLLGGRLFMDITAVLFDCGPRPARSGGGAFGALYIASTLPVLLGELAKQSTHHQKSQLDNLRHIVQLAQLPHGSSRTHLTVVPSFDAHAAIDPLLQEHAGPIWAATYATARHHRCYLLDDVPQDAQSLPELRDRIGRGVITPATVVRTLEQAALLTADRAQAVRTQLGISGGAAAGVQPSRDARVFCSGPMAQLLRRARPTRAGVRILQDLRRSRIRWMPAKGLYCSLPKASRPQHGSRTSRHVSPAASGLDAMCQSRLQMARSWPTTRHHYSSNRSRACWKCQEPQQMLSGLMTEC